MNALSNAYVLVPVEAAACLLPHSLRVGGLEIEIGSSPMAGPMPGSQRYRLEWRQKGYRGQGLVDINPASSATSELHIELRPPEGWMAKLFFSSERLNRPAWDLSDGIRSRIEVAAGRRARSEAKAKEPRVALKPAVPATEPLEFLSRL